MRKLKPHDYQSWCVNEAVTRLSNQQGVMAALSMGLGKTIITLLVFQRLRRLKLVSRMLILAPKRVCELTWPDEIGRWSDFKDLTYTNLVNQTPKKRRELLQQKADICISTVDSAVWLADEFDTEARLKKLPYDMLVCDESSLFKTFGSGRSKALRKLLPRFKKRMALSATPRPNGVLDLFHQMLLLDDGDALGKRVGHFKSKFGYMGGYKGYIWTPHKEADEEVNELVKHLIIRLDAEDHLNVPPMITNTIWCDFDKLTRKRYKQIEEEMFLALGNGDELIPANAGARYQSCKQFTGGAVYTGEDERTAERVHSIKLNLLLETLDACGPAIVAYQYQWEHDAILALLKGRKVASMNGQTKSAQAAKAMEQWNAGKLDVLLAQPQGVSHGTNLQKGPGRDILWFGLTDIPEIYEQFNGRVHRQGVGGEVRIHHLLVKGTVDAAIEQRLRDKSVAQKSMLRFLRDLHVESLGLSKSEKISTNR
jgi:SNF2 family DNA or RNA helicase